MFNRVHKSGYCSELVILDHTLHHGPFQIDLVGSDWVLFMSYYWLHLLLDLGFVFVFLKMDTGY